MEIKNAGDVTVQKLSPKAKGFQIEKFIKDNRG